MYFSICVEEICRTEQGYVNIYSQIIVLVRALFSKLPKDCNIKMSIWLIVQYGIVQFLYRLASATQSVTSARGSTNSFNLTQCIQCMRQLLQHFDYFALGYKRYGF